MTVDAPEGLWLPFRIVRPEFSFGNPDDVDETIGEYEEDEDEYFPSFESGGVVAVSQ